MSRFNQGSLLNHTLLTIAEIAASTSYLFPSYRLNSACSSNSFRCALWGHPSTVFYHTLRHEPTKLYAHLIVLGHCHHADMAWLYCAAASLQAPSSSPTNSSRGPSHSLRSSAAPDTAPRSRRSHLGSALLHRHRHLRNARLRPPQAGTIHNRLASSYALVSGDGERLGTMPTTPPGGTTKRGAT